MKRIIYLIGAFGLSGLFSGCTETMIDIHIPGSAQQQIKSDNGLGFNSITYNQEALSRLQEQALSVGTDEHGYLLLSPEVSLVATVAGRKLLHHAAQCALGPNDTLVTEHDGQQFEFHGLFGAAPTWSNHPLDSAQRRIVSSCLLAHINAYGIPVEISVRIPGVIPTTTAELTSHPVFEGAFFGDIFAPGMPVYACAGSDREIAAAHAPDRLLRACTDSSIDCPLEVVGRCRDVCETFTGSHGWSECWAGGKRYDDTTSVFLHDPDDHQANRTCGAGNQCRFMVSADNGIIDCSDAQRCSNNCRLGSTCTVEGYNSGRIESMTRNQARSETGCQGVDECKTTCIGNSTCDIDCFGATACHDNICADGAECLLDCTGAHRCRFTVCEGGQTSCANDVVVCNRACP